MNPSTGLSRIYGARPSALIMILQDIQAHYRYLPKDALESVSRAMRLPLAQIYGVATFYRAFSLKPKGKTIFACAPHRLPRAPGGCDCRQLERELGITIGETTSDGEMSFESVNCLALALLDRS